MKNTEQKQTRLTKEDRENIVLDMAMQIKTEEGFNAKVLAEKYNVSTTTIYSVIRKATKKRRSKLV